MTTYPEVPQTSKNLTGNVFEAAIALAAVATLFSLLVGLSLGLILASQVGAITQ